MVTEGAAVRLLTPGDIRELAGRLGVRPSKRLGQNFVMEPGTVRRIAALAALRAATTWCWRWARDLARSRSPCWRPAPGRWWASRSTRCWPPSCRGRSPPARRSGRTGWPWSPPTRSISEASDLPAAPSVLVANLPYNVAVPVLLHLLAALPSLRRGLVMVQAEVADRMCAAPGSRVYGAPSVKLAWFAAARPAGPVPRSVFWPVPNVDSRLVAFTRRDPPDTAATREEVFAVIDAAFRQRRKTLRAALSGWAGSAPEAERLLRAAGLDPGARGESLGVAEFARLAAAQKSAQQSAPPAAPRTIYPS